MKNILIIALIFISITSTAKAVYESVKYRDVSDLIVLNSKYFDEKNISIVRFEDKISPTEKTVCYLVQNPFTPKAPLNQLPPNISCVK